MSLQVTWRAAPSRLGLVFRKTASVDPLDPLGRGDGALPREPAIFVSRPGPAGPPGSGATVRIDQSAPAGTWILPHGFGRRPSVDVYLMNGEKVIADVTTGASTVTVVFATPQSGYALLS